MSTHRFTLKGAWSGGLGGAGTLEGQELATSISVPRALGGPGVGSNPEELLLGAAAACYLVTLAAILQRRGIIAEAVAVESEASFDWDGKRLELSGIRHTPRVRLTSAAQAAELADAVQAAESACMVSRALRAPVAIAPPADLGV